QAGDAVSCPELGAPPLLVQARRARSSPACAHGLVFGHPKGGTAMKVGLFINTQYPEEENVPAQIPALVEQVRVARDAGFKSLWFPHHWLTAPMQMLQIMPAMAFLAAEAKGMVIGPNILILPLLNPMHGAEEGATLDVITGGNYVLGAGLGYREPEFTAFGIPLAERAGRFSESVTLMRKLWGGGKITHQGKFFTVRDAGISLKPAAL